MLIKSGVSSIACAAAGECVAGGSYRQGPWGGVVEAFLISETNGSWGKPIRVPGTAPLNAFTTSVSCPAVGDCVAGGSRLGSAGQQAFVVTERNGRWGKAIDVTGPKLNTGGGDAEVNSISCAAVGECAAAGVYEETRRPRRGLRAFVVNETKGSWGKAIEVPGTETLITRGFFSADADSISCPAAGECDASGWYARVFSGSGTSSGSAFVVSETHGTWHKATEVPGMAALNSGGKAVAGSISCPAPGECAAGGIYSDDEPYPFRYQAFVVSKTNGIWDTAIEVPGTAALNVGSFAQVTSLSCAAVGDCAAGGFYRDGSGNQPVFVVDETNGVWGTAIEVPGTAAPGDVLSISCAAPGECTAGGYDHASGRGQAFVVTETKGVWGTAIEVPGTAQLHTRSSAELDSISCAAPGQCSAGGGYGVGDNLHAFVVGETNGDWGNAIRVRNFPGSCFVPNVVRKPIGVAKRKLRAFGCGVGRITKVYSAAKSGRVVAQRPKSGTEMKVLKAGARVVLVVSKGPKT